MLAIAVENEDKGWGFPCPPKSRIESFISERALAIMRIS